MNVRRVRLVTCCVKEQAGRGQGGRLYDAIAAHDGRLKGQIDGHRIAVGSRHWRVLAGEDQRIIVKGAR